LWGKLSVSESRIAVQTVLLVNCAKADLWSLWAIKFWSPRSQGVANLQYPQGLSLYWTQYIGICSFFITGICAYCGDIVGDRAECHFASGR
jgi:hypothetical protein